MYKQIQSKLILVQDSAMSSKWGLLGVTCTWTCFTLFITVLLRESWNNNIMSTLFVDILFHIICWHTVFHLVCGTASVRSYGYITRRWNNTFCKREYTSIKFVCIQVRSIFVFVVDFGTVQDLLFYHSSSSCYCRIITCKFFYCLGSAVFHWHTVKIN